MRLQRCAGVGLGRPAYPHYSNTKAHKDGRDRDGKQRYCCSACRRSFTARTSTPSQNHRWPRDVIVMAIRCYLRYGLSAANVRDLLAERGIDVSRQTIAAWVQKFGGHLTTAARRYAKRVGWRWYVDETYVRVGKKMADLYRAVDGAGQVVLLREKSNLASVEVFFEQANKEPRRKRTGYLVEQASLLHVMQLLVLLALLLDIRGDHSFITMLAYGTRKVAV